MTLCPSIRLVWQTICHCLWVTSVVTSTAILELWMLLVVILSGLSEDLRTALLLAIAFNLFVLGGMVYFCGTVAYHKIPCVKEDPVRWMCISPDWWPPYPNWEWGMPPLLWNVCEYSKKTGWSQIYPSGKSGNKAVATKKNEEDCIAEVGGRTHVLDEHDTSTSSSHSTSSDNFVAMKKDEEDYIAEAGEGTNVLDEHGTPTSSPDSISISDPGFASVLPLPLPLLSLQSLSCIVGVEEISKITKDHTAPMPLTKYEMQYLTVAKEQKLPTAVCCVCYLLSKESNSFLMESVSFFSKVHRAPIYVMINARGDSEGAWVDEQLNLIFQYLKERCLYQVRVFFCTSSRSKAANQNTFIDVLPKKSTEDSTTSEHFKYAIHYDVDDRPTFNEHSLLAHAEKRIGNLRNGHKVVGIQGPCVECFNDTLPGLVEALTEYNCQWGWTLDFMNRFYGRINSQGSNYLILTSASRRYKYNTKVLLEDWHCSSDMQNDENLTLEYTKTMVCYGQTPSGWNAMLKRRNRWYKGRFQETIRDALRCPKWGSTCTIWMQAWGDIIGCFIFLPLLHVLIIWGFNTIFQQSKSHGCIGVLDVKQLDPSLQMYGKMWNLTCFTFIGMIVAISMHGFMCILNMKSSCFLNGRKTGRYNFCHMIIHVCDAFLFFYGPVTLYYQYNFYCRVEYAAERLFCLDVQWIPTPKKAAAFAEDDFVKPLLKDYIEDVNVTSSGSSEDDP